MVRYLLGTLAGALVYYAWGMAAWMVLPLHDGTMHGLPDEAKMVETISTQQLAPGYYYIPSIADEDAYSAMSEEEKQAAKDDIAERYRQGPLASIIVAEGTEQMSPSMMLGGMGIDLVGAAVLGMVMSIAGCCRQYWQRVGLGTALGVFVGIAGYGALYNWMMFPADFIGGMIIDVVIGWTLAAAAMAAIIRPMPAADGPSS